MGIRNLLRKEQTVARDGVGGIVVGLREHAWNAETGEGREGEGELVRLQIPAGNVSPARMGRVMTHRD